jgi:hypothetical protein
MRVSTPHFQPFGPSVELLRLLCPLLTSPPRSRALRPAQSGSPDTSEISRGKTDRRYQAGPRLSSRAGWGKRRPSIRRRAWRNDLSTTRNCIIPVAIWLAGFYIGNRRAQAARLLLRRGVANRRSGEVARGRCASIKESTCRVGRRARPLAQIALLPGVCSGRSVPSRRVRNPRYRDDCYNSPNVQFSELLRSDAVASS